MRSYRRVFADILAHAFSLMPLAGLPLRQLVVGLRCSQRGLGSVLKEAVGIVRWAALQGFMSAGA